MKTLSELRRERMLEERTARQSHAERCLALLKSSADVPVFKNTDSTNVTDYTKTREMVRRVLEAGNIEFYEVACDHCGTQLVNHEPGASLLSSPPQRRVGCPGCGWLGSTSVFG